MITTTCKFRCISMTEQIGRWTTRLLVVTEKGSEENHLFWKYTPSGELQFESIERPDFEVGKPYYVHVHRVGSVEVLDYSEPSAWFCSKAVLHSRQSVEYFLNRHASKWNKDPAPHAGEMRFQVDNAKAVAALGHCIGEAFSVTFEEAPE